VCDSFSFALNSLTLEEVSGDVIDLIMSLGDFNEFKQAMLAVKRARGASGKTFGSLSVFGVSMANNVNPKQI